MELTFLDAQIPLTKTFKSVLGTIEGTPYPNVSKFTSHAENCASIAGMYDALKDHAAANRCLLKGNPTRALVNESRASSTVANAPTSWLCLDVDGLPAKTSIDSFLHTLGIDDVTHIIQYSASSGIKNSDLRCHVFVWLTEPTSPLLIKQWLIHKNLESPLLNKALSLSSTHMSLKYGLDITTCQNDKLIYIAAPKLVDIKDPFAKKPRIKLVQRSYDTFKLDLSPVPSVEANKRTAADVINRLRLSLGLEVRALKTTKVSNYDVLGKPDAASISEIKTDRGFVYFNLNGGDSWAYYHPENNPDYIHNFKGEPSYRTKELLPEYWETVSTKQASEPIDEAPIRGDVQYLAFCDPKSSNYYRGTYNTKTEELVLHATTSTTQIKDFLKQHGLPVGDFIPEWQMTYDPHNPVRIDVDKKFINLFEPSEYMRVTPVPRTGPPPAIFDIIHHALGANEAITRHFINWLAYILQVRDRSLTAWVLHGTQGTGKGILIDHIIRPLLGSSNVAVRKQENLAEKFNSFIEQSLVVFIDEMEHSSLENSRAVMGKLKNLITERVVAVRAMRKDSYEGRNYSNWMFASNKPNPLAVDNNDRRINVAGYQPKALDVRLLDFKAIKNELQHFHDFLALLPVDDVARQTPLVTESRTDMMAVSESALDSTVTAIEKGDFDFFISQLPTDDSYKLDMMQLNKVDLYMNTLKTLIARTDRVTGTCNIARDELRRLLDYIVGNMPSSPHKFTSMLKHHKMVITGVWNPESGTTVRGIPAAWKEPETFDRYLAHFAQPVRQLKVVK